MNHTINDTMHSVVEELIREKGKGCVVSRNEITKRFLRLRDISIDSILPSDYCYNRINEGVDFSAPAYFEYCGRDRFKCLGANSTACDGMLIKHRPKGSNEDIVVGCCKQGVRQPIRYWYMQLHPGSDPGNFGIDVMINVIKKWGDVGVGGEDVWDVEEGVRVRKKLREDVSIGDIIGLAHGKSFFALVRVVGEAQKIRPSGSHWYSYGRKIEILSVEPEVYQRMYFVKTNKRSYDGLNIRKTLYQQSDGFVQYWYEHLNRVDVSHKVLNTIGVTWDDVPKPRPAKDSQQQSERYWVRNPEVVKRALSDAGGCCHINGQHATFCRENGSAYLEVHHLIGMRYQKIFKHSLDVAANTIAVCPTCHRMLHYGATNIVEPILANLYDERIARLRQVGIHLTKKRFIDFAMK